MALVIPPGFGSAALEFSGASGTAPYITTIGVDLSAAGGDFVAAADRVMASYGVAFANAWSDELVLERVTLAVGQDGPGGSVESSLLPIPSTWSAAFPPTSMAVIARKITNELGRRGRGRMFLPAVAPESEINSNGSINNSIITDINQALENFLFNLNDPLATLDGPPVPPVLLHSGGPGGSVPTPITSMVCAPLVGWIRGRIR